MSKDNFKVSVILPTYNRANIIDQCIKSVIEQNYSNWELIISDDTSNDETTNNCSVFNDHRIKYYRNNKNVGLPANRNRALNKASGDLVLFTEDDMVLDENCITILVDTYQDLIADGVKLGSISPALITNSSEDNEKRSMLDYARRAREDELSQNPCVIDRNTGLIYRNFTTDFKNLIKVDDCHSCSLYPREIFDEFRYEENAFKGNYIGEESDLHFRLIKKGFNLYFQPKAVMIHNVKSQGGCRLPLYLWGYYLIRNHIIFLNRNFGVKSLYMTPYFLSFILFAALKYYVVKN
jgi:glycosyltransferase involved in cell wall biosynthesis